MRITPSRGATRIGFAMHSSPSAADSPRRFRPWGCFLVMALAAVATTAGLLVAYRVSSSWRVEQMLDDLRREERPVTAADLEAYYSLPDGAIDTAPLWLEATAALVEPGYWGGARDLPVVGGIETVPPAHAPWPHEQAVAKHLAEYAEAIRLMHEAARIGGPGRYPTDYSKGVAHDLPHINRLRRGFQLLNWTPDSKHGAATPAAPRNRCMRCSSWPRAWNWSRP
jgi:hypothetical protein